MDVFSDWSEDDLADNILNQDDEKLMSALKAQVGHCTVLLYKYSQVVS